MRTITKGPCGPHALERAHENPPATDREAQSRWSSFGHKPVLSQLLADEQYGLCAYSEVDLARSELGSHIEHIRPKSRYPQRTFDYQNLVLSALAGSDLETMDEQSVFGGHHKLGQYDDQRFISCITDNSSDYFAYLSDGKVVPKKSLKESDQAKADYTIDLLNLNSPYLVAERRRWLDELDALIDEHIEQNLPLSDLAAIYLLPRNERLDSFFTANRQRFKKLGDDLLKQQAPALCR